ncbi:hypothetical protein IE53DRAFT_389642 [Violaceomyces palustris]|uniref:Uncharacterized protein n=1 Tax=Violaceomyces palustris TaxID=1673888 RepID=A0ACD0NQW5_9BASI|nr:hypothetical protein IE53DRAFT_389642 [Violaceomyces palustris]
MMSSSVFKLLALFALAALQVRGAPAQLGPELVGASIAPDANLTAIPSPAASTLGGSAGLAESTATSIPAILTSVLSNLPSTSTGVASAVQSSIPVQSGSYCFPSSVGPAPEGTQVPTPAVDGSISGPIYSSIPGQNGTDAVSAIPTATGIATSVLPTETGLSTVPTSVVATGVYTNDVSATLSTVLP